MKAAILYRNKKPLLLADLEIPDKLEVGQVLVKIHYSGICGAQINEIDGTKGKDNYLPHLLGHEGSGIVQKIGPGVSTVKMGDHVVLHWRKSDGIQSATPKYKFNGKTINAGWVTTFNEKAIVSENRLTVIPKNFDMKLAPLFGCAVTTAFGVVNNDAKIKIGESVIIYGIGGVGLNIIQAASMVSAYPIIGIDIKKNKLLMGKKFGLTHGLLGHSKSLNEKIKKILRNGFADVVIDTTGNSKIIEEAYKLTSSSGKTILVGVPKKNDNISIYSLPLHFDKTISGSHGGNSKPDHDIPKLIRLINAGKMSLKKIVTHEFKLKDINKAIKLFRTGTAGRIIIKTNDDI